MWRGSMAAVALMAFMLAFAGIPSILSAQEAPEPVDEMWIDLGIRPQLVDQYNEKAGPNDIARVDHISMVDVLDDVDVGQKLVIFKSVVDAEALLPRLGDPL